MSTAARSTTDSPPEALDTRGLRCPVPVLRARQRLKELPTGALLELIGDDPLLTLDVQTFCAREGHEYLGREPVPGGGWRLTLRRGP